MGSEITREGFGRGTQVPASVRVHAHVNEYLCGTFPLRGVCMLHAKEGRKKATPVFPYPPLGFQLFSPLFLQQKNVDKTMQLTYMQTCFFSSQREFSVGGGLLKEDGSYTRKVCLAFSVQHIDLIHQTQAGHLSGL